MPQSPRLEPREAIRYVAIAGTGHGESAFRAFADRSFPAVFGAVAERGLTPVAAPFFRLFRFVPGGAFEVEVGVPVDGGGDVPPPHHPDAHPGDAYLAALPAGRYAVHVHEGAYSADDETWAGRDLASAHQHLQRWADDQGLRWATDPGSGRWTSCVEQYLVGPAETADVAEWRTLIAKLVVE